MKEVTNLKSNALKSIVGKDTVESIEEVIQAFSSRTMDCVLDASKYNIDEQEMINIIDDWAVLNKADFAFLLIKDLPEELKQKQIIYSIKHQLEEYVGFEGQEEYEKEKQFDMILPVDLKENLEKKCARNKFSYIDLYRYFCGDIYEYLKAKDGIVSTDEFEFLVDLPDFADAKDMLKEVKIQDKSELVLFLEMLRNNNGNKKNLNTIRIDDISILTTEQATELHQKYNINNIGIIGEFIYSRYDFVMDTHTYTIDEYVSIKEKIDEMLVDVDMSKPDIEKFLKIYKKLGETIKYARDNEGEPSKDNEAHNLKGGLFDGRSVCEGYSLILKQVLISAGIECKYVEDYTGSDMDKMNPKDYHAWNQVNIGGKWYNCDLTWDSPTIVAGRELEYCLQGEDDFINHKIDYSTQEECLESYDINKISEIMNKNKYGIREIRRFMEWYFKDQTLLQIDDFKNECLKYGLNFETEMNKAKNKVKLQSELDNTNGKIPDNKKEYFMQLAAVAELDLYNECVEAKERKILREYIKENIKQELDIKYISDACEYLGLNSNYEIIGVEQKNNERRITILPEQIGKRTIDADTKTKLAAANIENNNIEIDLESNRDYQ